MNDAQTYLTSRAEFRDRAARAFVSAHPEAAPTIGAANELVAGLCLFASRKDFGGVEHGSYISDLLVSFCRSHFIAVELVANLELVEAGVLIRKQMELVSRLHELRSGTVVRLLIGRPPNVNKLQENLRRRYGEYSAIAHSSDPKLLFLLGRIREGQDQYTPFYPVFDKNAYAALSHLGFVVAEFSRWLLPFYRSVFVEYDSSHHDVLFQNFWEALERFHKTDFDSIVPPTSPHSRDESRLSGMLASWSVSKVCGRADFLALAALFEFRRIQLERVEPSVSAATSSAATSGSAPRAAAAVGSPEDFDTLLERRDALHALTIKLAYQHAIGCVNFVAHAASAELLENRIVDDLFVQWLPQVGITRPVAELESQAIAELGELEKRYEAEVSRAAQSR